MTGTGPTDDAGTVKLAKNSPLAVVVTVGGDVIIAVPLYVIATVELGSNPAPPICTDVLTGPESGSRKMIGFTNAVTVKVFEAELEP